MAQQTGLPGFEPTPANAVPLDQNNTTLSVVGNTGNTKVPNTPIYKYVGKDGVLTYTDQAPQLPSAPPASTPAALSPVVAPVAPAPAQNLISTAFNLPGYTPSAQQSPSVPLALKVAETTPRLDITPDLFANATPQRQPQSSGIPGFNRNVPQYDLLGMNSLWRGAGDLLTAVKQGLLSKLANWKNPDNSAL